MFAGEYLSIILGLNLEVCFGVSAYGAHFGSHLAKVQVTAVAALPDAIVVATEHHATLHVLQQLLVARLVITCSHNTEIAAPHRNRCGSLSYIHKLYCIENRNYHIQKTDAGKFLHLFFVVINNYYCTSTFLPL